MGNLVYFFQLNYCNIDYSLDHGVCKSVDSQNKFCLLGCICTDVYPVDHNFMDTHLEGCFNYISSALPASTDAV